MKFQVENIKFLGKIRNINLKEEEKKVNLN